MTTIDSDYDCAGRPMTPTAVGYEAAAFFRYHARFGADVDNRIEFFPSRQWEGYGSDKRGGSDKRD